MDIGAIYSVLIITCFISILYKEIVSLVVTVGILIMLSTTNEPSTGIVGVSIVRVDVNDTLRVNLNDRTYTLIEEH